MAGPGRAPLPGPLTAVQLCWLLEQPEVWAAREATKMSGWDEGEVEPRDRLEATAYAIGEGFRYAMAQQGDSPVGDEVYFRDIHGATAFAVILGLSGRLYVWDARARLVQSL